MRKLFMLSLLLLSGCQSIAGPFQSRPPTRIDDPRLTPSDQEVRLRDRLALPDNTGGAPRTGAEVPGTGPQIRY
jgi:hypothetical protein